MKLTLVAGECPDGVTCPAVYSTDRGTVLVQGHRVDDPKTLGALRLGADEAVVELPAELFTGLIGRADRG